LVVEPHLDPKDMALAAELPKLPTILCINKVDKVKDKQKLLPLLAQFSERGGFAAIIPMSARRTDGTDRLLKELGELLPEQPFLFPVDTLSDQPTRFFVSEFVREQILSHTRQEVPHGVAVVVERFEEGGKVPHIQLTVHVSREAHTGIV